MIRHRPGWYSLTLLLIFTLSACKTIPTVLQRGRVTGPAVVPMTIEEALEGHTTRRKIVASGVPRPYGRVITALHVLNKFPIPLCPVRQEDEQFVYEINTLPTGDDRIGKYAGDIGWLRTSCRYDRIDKLNPKVPPIGTRVWVSGYPGIIFSGDDVHAENGAIEPSVIEGIIVDSPQDMTAEAAGCVAVEIDGIWSEDLHGFSGGPCAYLDDEGVWVVFGIAVRGRGDALFQVLGVTTPMHAEPHKAILYVAPIPEEFLD